MNTKNRSPQSNGVVCGTLAFVWSCVAISLFASLLLGLFLIPFVPEFLLLDAIIGFFVPGAVLMSVWTAVLALMLWPFFERMRQIAPRAPLFMATNFCSGLFVFAIAAGVVGLKRDGEFQGAFFSGLFIGAGTLWPLLFLALACSIFTTRFYERRAIAIALSVAALSVLIGGGAAYVLKEFW